MELTIADLKPFLPGLEEALDDEAVSEVMINAPGTVFVERAGRMAALDAPALTAEAVARAAVQIARPLRMDPLAEPIIDARLADGSRVAICGPPASPNAAITIRRFGGRAFTVDELTASGSLPPMVVQQTAGVLKSGRNVLISGGTGSGKMTLLNALVSLLPAEGRIVSIEDTLELRLRRANCLRFEARGLIGRDVTIRDLVRHALRHRPDHIVVGEVRGAEAADLLQALNTGHGGSLATVHANNAEAARRSRGWRPAPCRASDALPWAVVCRGIVDGIKAVIHQTRTLEGAKPGERILPHNFGSGRDYRGGNAVRGIASWTILPTTVILSAADGARPPDGFACRLERRARLRLPDAAAGQLRQPRPTPAPERLDRAVSASRVSCRGPCGCGHTRPAPARPQPASRYRRASRQGAGL